MGSGLFKRGIVMKKRLPFIILLTAVFGASAQEYFVSAGGSHTTPYNSWVTAATNLQVAVEYARAQQGDSTDVPVINVAEGTTYLYDAVICDAPVIIKGAGRDKTILNGALLPEADTTRGITINASGVRLEDFTIMGCTNVITTAIGGIGICMNAKGTINNVRITKNVNWNPDRPDYNKASKVYGAGLYMTDGCVTNCIIDRNDMFFPWDGARGCGLYMKGGEVVDCEIRDNWRGVNKTDGRYQTYGVGAYLDGGTLRRCTISGNNNNNRTNNGLNDATGLGLYLANANAVVDSCTIVSNSVQGVYISNGKIMNSLVYGHNYNVSGNDKSRPSGIEMTGGSVYNCTITDNIVKDGNTGLKMTGGTAINNIIFGNTNQSGEASDAYASAGTFNTNIVSSLSSVTTASAIGNQITNPGFTDPEAHDYSTDFSSPAFDAGAKIDDVTADINGVTRPKGDAYDIGCYEYAPSGTEILLAFMYHEADYPLGRTITLTGRALGGSGTLSYSWYLDDAELEGETGKSLALSNLTPGKHTVELVVTDTSDNEASIETEICVKPVEVYVSFNGSDENNYPYHDKDKPAKSIKAAWDALWPEGDILTRINIAEGEYMLETGLVCDTPIVIKGAGRDVTILNGALLYNISRGITINAAGVRLEDFTITGCTNDFMSVDGGVGILMNADGFINNVRITKNANWSLDTKTHGHLYGGGIQVNDGIVTNCIIDHNANIVDWDGARGCGLYMKGGEVVDCEIRDNWRGKDLTTGRGQSYGIGAYLDGGTLRRSTIFGNNNDNLTGSKGTYLGDGIGVYINGANGVVENCIVVSNDVQGVYMKTGKLINSLILGHKMTDNKYAGGVEQKDGSLYNCTIADNFNTANDTKSDLYQTGGVITNTIALKAVVLDATSRETNLLGENGVAIDPKFVNAAKGNYRLHRSSPAVNAGDNGVWDGIEDATDLDGKPRISNNKIIQVDIGCYEVPPNKATFIMLR